MAAMTSAPALINFTAASYCSEIQFPASPAYIVILHAAASDTAFIIFTPLSTETEFPSPAVPIINADTLNLAKLFRMRFIASTSISLFFVNRCDHYHCNSMVFV